MFHRRPISPKLICSIDVSAFAGVMVVLVVIVMLAGAISTPSFDGISANLPKVWRAVSMPGANREDALLVVVMQDGKVFFGRDQINTDALPSMILDRLKDRSVERKVYIRADVRARYGTVKKVLDGARSAGVERIAFITYQRQLSLGGR